MRNNRRRNRRRKGFTLIELLTVVIIITMLAAFVVPRMFKGLGKAKRDIARSKMAILDSALGQFYYDCGRMPMDEEGLDALLTPPVDIEEKWNGRYLKPSDILDPWGNPYLYFSEGMVNIGSYDLVSFGADGMEGGEDDNVDIYND